MKNPSGKFQRGFIERTPVRIVLGLLLLAAILTFIQSKKIGGKNLCMFNLNQIEMATENAGQNDGIPRGNTPPLSNVITYIRGGAPACPQGGEYTYPPIGSKAICSVHGSIGQSTDE